MEKLTINVKDTSHTLPIENGSWVLKREQGYSPVQMLVSAVASCGGYVYASVLNNSKIPHEIEKIEVSYLRDEKRKTNPVESIDFVIHVKIAEEFHEKAERCVKLISPNCPVIQSIDPAIVVTEAVKFI